MYKGKIRMIKAIPLSVKSIKNDNILMVIIIIMIIIKTTIIIIIINNNISTVKYAQVVK